MFGQKFMQGCMIIVIVTVAFFLQVCNPQASLFDPAGVGFGCIYATHEGYRINSSPYRGNRENLTHPCPGSFHSFILKLSESIIHFDYLTLPIFGRSFKIGSLTVSVAVDCCASPVILQGSTVVSTAPTNKNSGAWFISLTFARGNRGTRILELRKKTDPRKLRSTPQ